MRTNALGYTRASRLLAGAVVRVHQVRFSAHERVLLVVTLYVSQFSVVNELARTEAPRLAAGVVDGHSKNRESGGGDGPLPTGRRPPMSYVCAKCKAAGFRTFEDLLRAMDAMKRAADGKLLEPPKTTKT